MTQPRGHLTSTGAGEDLDPGSLQAQYIGAELREQRQAQDKTLQDVEEGVSVSAPYLSKIECGRVLPQPETFEEIAGELDLPAQDIKRLSGEVDFARDCSALVALGLKPTLAWLAAALNRADEDVSKAAAKAVKPQIQTALRQAAGSRGSQEMMRLVGL